MYQLLASQENNYEQPLPDDEVMKAVGDTMKELQSLRDKIRRFSTDEDTLDCKQDDSIGHERAEMIEHWLQETRLPSPLEYPSVLVPITPPSIAPPVKKVPWLKRAQKKCAKWLRLGRADR
ncbi:hypothetical protein CLAFUW4_10712 [Fulvia fulva]|uniref:Uncharacterized protein n=1 Tax=Passalora fulva TaxID=5499 RepID=A0A9Q8P839_PASFU|nr:uncharacterized protein CLAFUR5_05327 [Fulvia fulva]KAK4615356.1 hypothetical protein CLAFUR4_10717 [Fulvia fulva]KAK4617179.1 hypothetical protein CLAFUR0_10724 [Fulvia fulva]UJO16785.1 hypothetical protein CLAFUR5_05327 [Fulvia fulva]WPV19151.1 hypothetical protein CLAFUW4_10712 [Fulvia fulva]WPV34319.1 hypothetical protein CLAFUW7_10714 [Fulvia fulva]